MCYYTDIQIVINNKMFSIFPQIWRRTAFSGNSCPLSSGFSVRNRRNMHLEAFFKINNLCI